MKEKISQSFVFEFLKGTGEDYKGRKIKEIWDQSDQWLENTHDYIQWLFPLDVRSFHQFHSPVLKGEELEICKKNDIVQKNILISFHRMLDFYGLKEDFERRTIEKNESFEEQSYYWLFKNNHNHLRLTRIVKSLYLLGFEEKANMLLKFLVQLTKEKEDRFTLQTKMIWERLLEEKELHAKNNSFN